MSRKLALRTGNCISQAFKISKAQVQGSKIPIVFKTKNRRRNIPISIIWEANYDSMIPCHEVGPAKSIAALCLSSQQIDPIKSAFFMPSLGKLP